MTVRTEPAPYEVALSEFKIALARVLSGSVLPPGNGIPDGPLTTALLDIAYAARAGQPTNYLVSRACFLFARTASDHEATEPATAVELKAIS